jgi:hypothetical protein
MGSRINTCEDAACFTPMLDKVSFPVPLHLRDARRLSYAH